MLSMMAAPATAGYWGVSASFADCDSAQSDYEAPVLAQRGVGGVFLSMRGAGYNWPNWVQVQRAWETSGVSTFWETPGMLPEAEKIFGFTQGSFETDDRPVLFDGSRAYYGGTLGNFLNPKFALEIERVIKAMARRLQKSSGYQVLEQTDLGSGSYDPDSLTSWRAFLKSFTGDDSPDNDTSRDSVTLNSAFGLNYTSWDQVPQFTSDELSHPHKRMLVDLWLASSSADFADKLCTGIQSVNRAALAGPRMTSAVRASMDVSVLLSRKHVNVVYAGSADAVPGLSGAAAAFEKKLIANGIPLIPGEYEASLQRALHLLPYVDGALFDYAGLVSERTGPLARQTAAEDEPRPYDAQVEAVPGKILRFDPAFQVISQLAPFAGRIKAARARVLWIVPSERVLKNIGLAAVDGVWVSEGALALDPNCLDLSRYKAIIYYSPAPSINTNIMQTLFSYALAGGTVILDARAIASGPTILNCDNSHFWWQDLKPVDGPVGTREIKIELDGESWSMRAARSYLSAAAPRIRHSGSVRGDSAEPYPLLLIRDIGPSGKWVFVNAPLVDLPHSLLARIVKSQSGIELPDPAQPRVYWGDGCALVIGGEKKSEVTVKPPFTPAIAFDIASGETAFAAEGEVLRLPGNVAPGQARLFIIKFATKPVVLYSGGTIDYAASLDDGSYSDGVLEFSFNDRAFVCCPSAPKSITLNGKQAQINYDRSRRIAIIENAGEAVRARLEFEE